MQTAARSALSASLLVCAALSTQHARASNDETYFLDSDAALAAGAVVASSAGGGSVWYNPAGLAHAERSNLSLSLSVASFQVRDYRDAIRITRADGSLATQSLNGGRVALLSPAVSYLLKLRAATLGAGLFTTRDDVLKVSAVSRYADGDGRESLVQTTLDDSVTRYHLGGGLGFALSPRVTLGVSMFGVYEGIDSHANVALSFIDPTQTPPLSAAGTASWRDQSWRAGAQATVGLRYAPLEQLSLGLALQTPMLMLHENVEASTLIQTAVTNEVNEDGDAVPVVVSEYDPHPRKAAPFGLATPLRATFGASLRIARAVISLEGDYAHRLRSLDVGTGGDAEWLVDRRAVFNVRAGALVRVSRSLELGGGLYTDRAIERRTETLGDTRVDYYGATLGGRLSKFLATAQRGASQGLVFQTTLALRYAVGTGAAGGLRYDFASDDPGEVDDDAVSAHVVFHELHAYLGSSVAY